MTAQGRALVTRSVLIGSTLWFSWLAMMLVHEAGHGLAARLTGGSVRHVVWHPLALSRTDVDPDPHPLVEVWAGPLVGGLLPLVQALAFDWRIRHAPAWAVVGFCLLANGAYLGVGALDPVGDAKQLIALGTPRWVLLTVGVVMAVGGLSVWNRISPAFGFGRESPGISPRDTYLMLAAALLLTAVCFACGAR